jgi:prolyl-tRNA synthetase
VLFDDRDGVRAGVKFSDADLIGIPWRINVGRDAAEGFVEAIERATGTMQKVAVAELVDWASERCLVPDRPRLEFIDPDLAG